MAEFNATIPDKFHIVKRETPGVIALPVSSFDPDKTEALLSLALESDNEEIMKSVSLSTGYNPVYDTYEIIFRYAGDNPDFIAAYTENYQLLGNGYAAGTVTKPQLAALSQEPRILFIEKSKNYFFSVNNGTVSSCIRQTSGITSTLSGNGVIVGIVDSGIDYTHPAFRTPDGDSRILYLLDQNSGTVYTKEDLDQALRSLRPGILPQIPIPESSTGHGTAVAGIAAGNGRGSVGNRYRGVAYESSIIAVRLGTEAIAGSAGDAFPRTRQIMEGANFIVEKALELQMPAAINLSYGNNYGSHNGNALLETYLDSLASQWKVSIVTASGNEGASGHHLEVNLANGVSTHDLLISEGEPSLTLQIWKEYFDTFRLTITAPDGSSLALPPGLSGGFTYTLMQSTLLIYSGSATPYNSRQETVIEWIPAGARSTLNAGVWKCTVEPVNTRSGQVNFWLPSSQITGRGTKFVQSTPFTTLTIPSTAENVISVGAYNSNTISYAAFSGRGYTTTGEVKPDLVAPGVNIMTTAPFSSYSRFSGTSMAAPFVTGSAALLMEWGIVKGNDPFLYGEKLKAYLIAGARPLAVSSTRETVYPNPETGWGRLCLEDSFPQG